MRTNEELIEMYLKQLPTDKCYSLHVPRGLQESLLEVLPLYAYNKPLIMVLNN